MTGRHATGPLLDALADTPVVYLQGARQTGKSTLVHALAEREHPASYLTLDSVAVLAAATGDPATPGCWRTSWRPTRTAWGGIERSSGTLWRTSRRWSC